MKEEQGYVDLGSEIEMTVKFIKPDTVLACPVYDRAGDILQTAYSPFTQEFLQQLMEKGVEKIYYSKKIRDIQALYTKDLKDYLQKNIYQGPRRIGVETQKLAVSVAEKIETTVKENLPIDFVDETKELIDCVLQDLGNEYNDVINLLDIQSYDDFNYSHSLNVAVIAMVFARKLGVSRTIIKDIGFAGIIHDIGKLRIPYDIINKKEQLLTEEYEIIKRHPRYGYEILKGSKDISDQLKKMVLTHHEKYDGTGYPFGLKEDQIDDATYILSLAEVFDALTTELSYKLSFSPQKAFNLIIRDSGTRFKPDLAHRFVKEMGLLFKESSFYPIGSHVILNTNEIGIVVEKDSKLTTRPSIQIVKNAEGMYVSRSITVNLNLDNSRHIVRIMSEAS